MFLARGNGYDPCLKALLLSARAHSPHSPLSLSLLPGSDRPALSFDQRLSVAADVADALRFLHSFTKPLIIHRDIKSDTVLLDDKLKVQTRVGISRHTLTNRARTHTHTHTLRRTVG